MDRDTLELQQRAEVFLAHADESNRRRLADELRDTIATVDATISRLAAIRAIRRGKELRRLTPQPELVAELQGRLAELAAMLAD
jgi:hypothetical protein